MGWWVWKLNLAGSTWKQTTVPAGLLESRLPPQASPWKPSWLTPGQFKLLPLVLWVKIRRRAECCGALPPPLFSVFRESHVHRGNHFTSFPEGMTCLGLYYGICVPHCACTAQDRPFVTGSQGGFLQPGLLSQGAGSRAPASVSSIPSFPGDRKERSERC